ncbi:hypothetical protein HPB48_020573 [Haemaphysalis longicornis]|uniref:Peptidase M13 N-terminal domain-containing protein n=1 Tax=Haemaphysalis longicornis TaxID=44386 RepID=A0A9J6GD77_HAELO|nr:hypothetical protein HPB48_020573 [Haemaphysalis longicornis]
MRATADARVRYLQKLNSWNGDHKEDASKEPTKEDRGPYPMRANPMLLGVSSTTTSTGGVRTSRRRSPSLMPRLQSDEPKPRPAKHGSGDAMSGLHAMQCADESCESESSYLKHLFSSGRDPCVDFYDFVCSSWKTQNSLPPSRRRWSVQDMLVQKIEGAVYWFLEVERGRMGKNCKQRSLKTTYAQPDSLVDEPELSLVRHRYFDVAYDLSKYRQLVTDALNFVNERNDSTPLAAEIVDLEQQLAEVYGFTLPATIPVPGKGMDASSGWIPESAQFEVLPLDELQATDSVSLCRRETLPLFRQFETHKQRRQEKCGWTNEARFTRCILRDICKLGMTTAVRLGSYI